MDSGTAGSVVPSCASFTKKKVAKPVAPAGKRYPGVGRASNARVVDGVSLIPRRLDQNVCQTGYRITRVGGWQTYGRDRQETHARRTPEAGKARRRMRIGGRLLSGYRMLDMCPHGQRPAWSVIMTDRMEALSHDSGHAQPLTRGSSNSRSFTPQRNASHSPGVKIRAGPCLVPATSRREGGVGSAPGHDASRHPHRQRGHPADPITGARTGSRHSCHFRQRPRRSATRHRSSTGAR